MALRDLDLLLDVRNRALLGDFLSRTLLSRPPQVFQGDTVNLRLRTVVPAAADAGRFPWTELPLTGGDLLVALGPNNKAPTAGTFTITDPAAGQTTAALAYDAEAAAVQAALRAALTTNYGGAVVTGSLAIGWTVNRGAAGAIAALTMDVGGVNPASAGVVTTRQTGTVALNAIVRLRLKQGLAALASAFTAFPAAAGTVTELTAGGAGVNEKQRVKLDPVPYGGFFTLTLTHAAQTKTTEPIAAAATAAEVQEAVEALANVGAGNVLVTKADAAAPEWDLQFTGALAATAIENFVLDVASLKVPQGLQGDLALGTDGIEELLATEGEDDQVETNLEIEWTPDGEAPVTLYRGPVVVRDDLIDGAATAPLDSTPHREGVVALENGTTETVVEFDAPMAAAPAVVLPAHYAPSAAGARLLVDVDESTITAAGFTLRHPDPGEDGHKAAYFAILA